MTRPTRRRPPAHSGPTSTIWIGILAVLILGGGATLAVLKKGQSAAQETEEQATEEQATEEQARDAEATGRTRPFADMPPEQPPRRPLVAAGSSQPFSSPASLLSDPLWQRAVELAKQGEELYQAAVEAKIRGEVPTLNQKGNEAKTRFDEALESTAELEETLIAERGETDPVVRDVLRCRNGWFDRVRWLHKSTSR